MDLLGAAKLLNGSSEMKQLFLPLVATSLLSAGQPAIAQGNRPEGISDFEVLSFTSATAVCVALHTPATIDEAMEGIRPFVRNAGLDDAQIEQIRNEYGTRSMKKAVQGLIDEYGCKELIPASAYERYGPYKPLGHYPFER